MPWLFSGRGVLVSYVASSARASTTDCVFSQNFTEESRAPSVNTGFPDSGRPIFKPREMRTADSVAWYVQAEWADGTIEEIGRFSSDCEAWDWIARHSREWLKGSDRIAR